MKGETLRAACAGLMVLACCVSVRGQSPLEAARNLLAEVEQLAGAERPHETENERHRLLERADSLCDAAAAAGGDVFGQRWQLAGQAWNVGAWAIAAALYDDCVAAYGDDMVGSLEPRRMAGQSHGMLQMTLPSAERDFGRALQLTGEVAEVRAALLEQALANAGPGRLMELEAAVEARRVVGVTYLNAGQRERARAELERAYSMLRDHVKRLEGPDLLRLVAIDLMNALDAADQLAMLDATARLMEGAFPDSQDLILDFQVDFQIPRVSSLLGQGRTAAALELARSLRDQAMQVRSEHPMVMLHIWQVLGDTFVKAQQPGEAEPLLARAQQIVDELRLTARNWDAQNVIQTNANMLVALGRTDEALALLDRILDENPQAAWVWQRRGRVRYAAGYLDEALADSRHALELLPAGEQRFQCLANIALIHGRAGRSTLGLAGLEALVDEVRRRPPQNLQYDLGRALYDLGLTRYELGDLRGAYPLLLEALQLTRAKEGPDGARPQRILLALGTCAFFLGRPEEYETTQRAARESLSRAGLGDSSTHYGATVNLAEALAAQGSWDTAREFAVEGGTAANGKGDGFFHGLALAVQGAVELGRGEPAPAAPLLRDGVARMVASRPGQEQDTLARYRGMLLRALAQLDDRAALQNEVLTILGDTRDRLDLLTTLSARERGEIMAALQLQAEQVMALHLARPGALDERDLFEWLATLRAVGGPIEVARQSGANQQRIDELRERALVLRRRVAALVHNAVPGSETHAARMAEATTERDAAERALLAALPRGSKFAWITPRDLAPRLRAQKAIAASVHRVRAMPPELAEDHFVAFVVDDRGEVRSADLGPAGAIEQAIAEWRRRVTGTDRGRPVEQGPTEAALGEALRKLVLDPVLDGVRSERVFLCLDDVLNTIPWDALPLDAKQLVGDRYRVASLASLRDLIDSTRRPPRQPALVAFGDIDYDAPGAVAEGVPLADRPAQLSGQPLGQWQPLAWSEDEIGKIGKSFEKKFRGKAKLVVRGAASKAALFEHVRGASWLHIATHGYLAPEALPARGETTTPGAGASRGGFAPMSLCGLVLAGGNVEVGTLDEVPGIVTAEELAGLDLAGCQLAVLSGCETGLGSRRAGQGLASLQAALHAAGAGNTIASLWPVQDKATSDLMARFYELMWDKKLPPDEALWQAKKALRDARRPLVSWAGWAFSGVPQR